MLRKHNNKFIAPDDFLDLQSTIPAMLYGLFLVTKHSEFFFSPSRVNLVTRLISNEVIDQTRQFVQIAEIFTGEPEEAFEKLKTALKMLVIMKEAFDVCKDKSIESSTDKQWTFDVTVAFSRLDEFILRVKKISYLFETLIDFNKIEKIEIGNSKGRILTTHLMQIFTDFNSRMSSISKIKYDLLDLKEVSFDTDYGVVLSGIEDLEYRIGTIISQAYEDSPCMFSSFRLIESFGALLTRKLVKEDFEPKFYDMLNKFSTDLDIIKTNFVTHKESPPIHSNMAPVTGALSWANELKERIKDNYERLQAVNTIIHFINT